MSWRAVFVCALCALPQANAGELTRRLERTLERTLNGGPPAYTQEFLLADLIPGSKRRFSNFSGDLSGRYLGSMALSGPTALEGARAFAPHIFDLQRVDGGFGPPISPSGATEDDMARLWGHGRLLVGLLEYHETTGDPQSLEAARRLGDLLVTHSERFNALPVRRQFQDGALAHGYICWTQNVEGLALLSRATGEEKYRKTASAIAEAIERRPGQHAHGWLSSLRGLALLAQDDQALLPHLESAWDDFTASENLLWTSGPPEYFAPGIARDEGCASADWVRLNLDLWRLTGRERYIAAAEDGLFNALFANQQPSGDFGHLKLSNDGFDYGAVQAWWCCTLHGLRGLEAVRANAFRATDGALYYDLPVDGQGALNGLRIQADSELARDGRVTLRILEAPENPIAVKIRKPARTTELRSPLGSTDEDSLVLERAWATGETVEVEYVFETQTAGRDGSNLIQRGPWTLGVSEGADPVSFGEGSQNGWVDRESLAMADRPSRLSATFHQPTYGSQAATLTLRPIGERWEAAGHALRWRTQFDPDKVVHGQSFIQRLFARVRRDAGALLVGFLLGGLSIGLAFGLRRRSA